MRVHGIGRSKVCETGRALARSVGARMRLVAFAALLCLGMLAVAVMPGVGEREAYAQYDSGEVVHYTVKPGDTLWSIADRFTDAPVAQTVERLKAVNGLDGGSLRAGQHLVIPV